MKAKKPDKCIKAQCGASCDFHTTDMLYGLGYDPQDCPYYRYNPNNENDKQNAWLMRRDEHRDKAMNLIPKSILEDIRAEIDSYCSDNRDRNDGLYIAMRIIDKYKEREDKE